MKGFFKNFFTLFIGTGLNILISLVTVPIITRLVNPSEYGQLSFFNMYSNIAYIILLLGLDQAYVRFFYKSNEEIYKRGIFYSCLKWPIILTSIVSIFIVIFGRNMLQVEEKYTNIVLLIFILNLFSLILQRFVLLTLRLEMNTKLFSFLNVLSKIIYTILAITLILIIKKDYYLILIFSTFFSTFATVVIGILCKRKLYINKNISTKGINKIELLKYGYPFIFSSILSMGFQYADKLTIKHYGTYEDVGIYAGALNIISMFSIINNVFNTLWAPMSMEHYEKQPNNKEFFIKGNQFITVIMFFMAINMILFKDIISMFLDKQYRLAAYILPFLVFEPVMNTISETTVNGINFAKKSKMHIIITFCCCIVNVIGNVILIPIIGSKGAAISTGLSYILFFILRTLIANHYYYIDFKLKKIFILIFFTIIYALYNTFFQFNWITIIAYLSLCYLIYKLYSDTIYQGIYILRNKWKNVRNKIIHY